jgi:protein-disulfide isomerase
MSKKAGRESAAARAAAVRAQQASAERRRNLFIVGGVAVLILVIVGVGLFIQNQRDTTGEAAVDPAGVTDTYGVVIGDTDAPKTITIYEDLQCPICHEFETATKTQLRQAVTDGKVNLDYRMVAFLDRASTTNYSSRALNAAAVVLDAAGPDVFLKFHDLLYENQPEEGSAGLTDAQLIQYAVQAGASEDEVSAGITGDRFGQWVVNATDQMSKNGVNGTPSVFVDGKYQGNTLGASIDGALAAVGATPSGS